jgi:hypothetical protein
MTPLDLPPLAVFVLVGCALAALACTIAITITDRQHQRRLEQELGPNRELLRLTEARMLSAPEHEQKLLPAPESERTKE